MEYDTLQGTKARNGKGLSANYEPTPHQQRVPSCITPENWLEQRKVDRRHTTWSDMLEGRLTRSTDSSSPF